MKVFQRKPGPDITHRLAVPWVSSDEWRTLLTQVFDMPKFGPAPRQQGDVRLETVSSALGWPFDLWEFDNWVSRLAVLAADEPKQRGLLLGDMPFGAGLRQRYGVRPGVVAIRPGSASYVMVTCADGPTGREALSRLRTASDLMVG